MLVKGFFIANHEDFCENICEAVSKSGLPGESGATRRILPWPGDATRRLPGWD